MTQSAAVSDRINHTCCDEASIKTQRRVVGELPGWSAPGDLGRVARPGWGVGQKSLTLSPYPVLCLSSIWLWLSDILLKGMADLVSKMFLSSRSCSANPRRELWGHPIFKRFSKGFRGCVWAAGLRDGGE